MVLGDINYTYFLLLLMRMSGYIFFNPIFGRNSVPVTIKTGLVLILSVITFTSIGNTSPIVIGSFLELIVLSFKEVLIGYIIGYIMNLFFGVVAVAGEVMGMQMGLSMSQIYDPTSNMSMGLAGTFLNIIVMFVFFGGNGHIQLIQIFTASSKIVGVGKFALGSEILKYLVEMLSQMLVLGVKLAMPMIAVEIILEAGIGILMKAIPQIHIFSVNIQLKLIVGLILLVILVPTFSAFTEGLMVTMFDTIKNSVIALGG